MSKRAPGLPQRPRGWWPTPFEAVAPLIPYLPPRKSYGEPCAGDGALIQHLAHLWPGGRCVFAADMEPQAPGIDQILVADLTPEIVGEQLDMWITNTPWPKLGGRGDPALSIIKHLITIAPGWFLLPFDFAANEYFKHVIGHCADIVPIGRVQWVPGSESKGKDNVAWFYFDAMNRAPPSIRRRA